MDRHSRRAKSVCRQYQSQEGKGSIRTETLGIQISPSYGVAGLKSKRLERMPDVGCQSTALSGLVLFDESGCRVFGGSTCPRRRCKCRLLGGQWRKPPDMLVPCFGAKSAASKVASWSRSRSRAGTASKRRSVFVWRVRMRYGINVNYAAASQEACT